MLEQTIHELQVQHHLDHLSDYGKLESMTAELEDVSNAFLLAADELYRFDSGESARVTALIYSLGLMASDFDRRRQELREVSNRITAAK